MHSQLWAFLARKSCDSYGVLSRSFSLARSSVLVLACAPIAASFAFVACANGADDTPTETPTPTPTSTTPTNADAGRPVFDSGVVTPDADASGGDAGPVDMGPGGDFLGYADLTAAALQKYYDSSNGLFSTTGWWNSANALTAMIDYMRVAGSKTYLGDISTTFDKNSSGKFLNDYYDDEGWWALAWIDAYDLTKDSKYLDAAKTVFDDMKGGWDDTCGGGIWWRKNRDYKNAIANELFLEIAVRLHQRTPNDNGKDSYVDWAKREWAWFSQSGMINADNLVNDGLKIVDNNGTKTCSNNGDTTWTYNQGVLVGALVELATSTNTPALVDRAQAIADATFAKLVDDQGVLREPCEPSCGGTDAPTFKGVFMRNLGVLYAAHPAPQNAAFLAVNADWIGNAAHTNVWNVGLSWSQAPDAADAARQASGLDALNAAIALSAPQPNVALSATATASSKCTDTEAADRAIDGNATTKWCGAGNDTWLELDLGSSTPIGRLVVRHAQAGGEKSSWNTKDFKLRVSDDKSTWTDVANVTGNTRAVTIHRRYPAQNARYVRLEVAAAQSDSSTVATRIYELEAYAR